jgi:hypothetical protein
MFLPLVFSLALAGASSVQDAPAAQNQSDQTPLNQTPTTQAPAASTDPLMVDLGAPQPAADPGAVDLGDLVVDGRRLDQLTRDFVREVAAPPRGRGLARWRHGVCVGVANLQNDAAQYIVDRVSTVSRDLDLKAGEPGCEPSVLIIATVNANEFTRRFVEMRPRLFIVGGGGMDLGRSGLERFKTNDQPVRWWTVSVPADADTGAIATRLPGEDAPIISTFASRLSTSIVDDTRRVFVILDVEKTANVSIDQLADYVTMVVLAQVDPNADTSGYATVLNVFDDPTQTPGLTDWDRAYLEGLYGAQRTRSNHAAHQGEVASSIIRAHGRIARERDAEDAAAVAADAD